ncbi:hypothetical protein H257_05304 [Aphanomyces astaci]|uniref:CENP-V/GFA domain-containing protein n=1 Tax=Aphanomyces astaci TaxID=112090 RepID=W4GQT4_APHAT|nr:hypothetical protein H257_05304 [Aphanomyces astaci]ETV81701.1 hypothetical protein H257_05304 [Aphanomyces astaci]RQM19715.1 hypothetical protein B5M09_011278 [Aphanomyces astaci]|eukprot:XP_009828438.1 hypothetical protein H257_05304 [Aphanomyces astaci]
MKTEIALTAAAGLVSWVGWQLGRVSTVRLDSGFACACQQVQGHVNAPAALHIVCYCDDCQKFATLTCQSTSKSPVDTHGGTDIVQVFPADVTVTKGKANITIAKLSDKTALLRVFASCCNTPLFNAIDDLAFIGLFTSTLKQPEDFGPVQFRIMGKFATSAPIEPVAPTFSLGFGLVFFTRALVVYRSTVPCPD